MAISICVPTYNRLEFIKKFVDSIRNGIGDYPYEIIVGDGGSNDGTIEYLKKQKDVTVVEMGGLTGGVKAYNACFKKAKYEYIFWPSDDFLLVPETLIKCCNLMDKHPEVGMVSPKFIESKYSNFPNVARWNNRIVISKTHVFRTSVLKEIGLLDDTFKTYYVDADSTLAVLNKGYTTMFTREVGAIHLRVEDETRKGNNVNSELEEKEENYYTTKWKDLENKLIDNPSHISRFKGYIFGHAQGWLRENSIMKRMMKKDSKFAIRFFDWLLQKCVVYKAKGYDHLKDFYLAQKLPEDVLKSK